jgi:hypothetical protein
LKASKLRHLLVLFIFVCGEFSVETTQIGETFAFQMSSLIPNGSYDNEAQRTADLHNGLIAQETLRQTAAEAEG